MSSPYTVFFDQYWFDTSLPSIVVYIVVSLFTIFSNLLLCVAYWKDPFNNLKSVQNYFVLNLAIADLIMGAVSEPLLIVTYWYDHNLIYFIHYLSAIISAACSLLNITALSIIRYFAVKQPFLTQSIVNERSVLISIGVVWVIAIHYALLPLMGWRDKSFQLYLYGLARDSDRGIYRRLLPRVPWATSPYDRDQGSRRGKKLGSRKCASYRKSCNAHGFPGDGGVPRIMDSVFKHRFDNSSMRNL